MRPGTFVPLGGRSNHFRAQTLRQIGGWDPFNVTKNCDLGVRLGRAALKGTSGGHFIETLFPAIVYYPALLSLVGWNFVLFYSNTYVAVRHNFLELTRYTLLTPLYWILMSLGAWTGLISLIRNPFYWAKTEHGVSLDTPAAIGAAGAGRVEPELGAREIGVPR
jgi:hypothetical protein